MTPKEPPKVGSIIREEKIDFWLTNGKSVLMIGRPGTAKTATCLDAFARNGLTPDKGLALWSIARNDFDGDPYTADVLYFDNFSTQEAQRAALEIFGLRQWKGKPVTAPIWASVTLDHDAENTGLPVDLTARFEVTVQMPYRPYKPWFVARYGEKAAGAAIEWWEALDDDTNKLVSPRKLAEALDMWAVKGDIRDVLPIMANVTKLATMLNTGPIFDHLTKYMTDNNKEDARHWLSIPGNRAVAMKTIVSRPEFMAFFLPLLSAEVLNASLDNDQDGKVVRYVVGASGDVPHFHDVLTEILRADINKKLVKRIRKALSEKTLSEKAN